MASRFELGDDDRDLLAVLEIDESELQRQIECFERGFKALDLTGPATVERGIEVLDPSRYRELEARWAMAARAGRLSKFVPASGAASRMFRALESRRSNPEPLTSDELKRGAAGELGDDGSAVARFFDRFDDFAFAPVLREALEDRGFDVAKLLESGDRREVLEVLLGNEGLGYASLPKGLIPFHRSEDGARTAFEEQLDEAREVVSDELGRCRVHFTVAPSYRKRIREHCESAAPGLDLSTSEQSPSTDTVAVDLDNRPFRDDDGQLVFRPGGHGALIGNLGKARGDVVLVKNVDNVVPKSRRDVVVQWQRLLVGVLLERQESAHSLWHDLQNGRASIDKALEFVQSGLHRVPPMAVRDAQPEDQFDWILDVLSRPIRVCGMVRNEGEPGGGPYWVRGRDGGESLQIVESVQIDHDDPAQVGHVRQATHFNPVDLVCGLRDPEGRPHDLHGFVDADSGFIAEKSKDGRPLKALERPGLWNGAMAHWNTVFVEVPIETFNPVKTVLDLLREAHQPA